MSRLDDLIAKLCPDGVEYKELGEIGLLMRGNGLQKKDFTGAGIGCIHYGQIYTYYGPFAYETKSFVSPEFADRLKKVDKTDLIITLTSENVEDVCKCVAWLGDSQIVTGGHAAILKHKQNPKYLSYYFQSESFFLQKAKIANGTKVIEVSIEKLAHIRIALPPLPVQREIVRILDTFSELTTELTARKKQYEYYRDTLLKFDESVPQKELGEIGILMRGNGLQKRDFTRAGIGCIHYGQIYTYYGPFAYETKSFVIPELADRLKKVDKGDLVITLTSENVEDVCKCVAWLGDSQIVTGGHAAIFRHNQNAKYLSYFFQSEWFFLQKEKIANGTKVIEVSPEKLSRIKIPVPPLSEQARIVSILDRFDALCNDLSSGLPAEIEARKKQYEYYRDKLLTF